MAKEISIRIPSSVDINNLDSNKFQKSTEKSGGQKTTVFTYVDRPDPKGLEKIGQKISNFFSGIKNARNSLTAVKAWGALGNANLMTGIKHPRFNNGLIQKTASELDQMQAKLNNSGTLAEIHSPDQRYSFSLKRT